MELKPFKVKKSVYTYVHTEVRFLYSCCKYNFAEKLEPFISDKVVKKYFDFLKETSWF